MENPLNNGQMESTFFTRLDEFMQYKGLNDNKITVQAKIAVGTLGKQRRSGKGLSYDSIVKILRTYPELNATWLILGDGEMLKKDEEPPANLVAIYDMMVSQAAIIKKQHEKIDLLISQLDYIRTQIATEQEMNRRIAEHLQVNTGKQW